LLAISDFSELDSEAIVDFCEFGEGSILSESANDLEVLAECQSESELESDNETTVDNETDFEAAADSD